MKAHNLTGKRFGKLVVVRRFGSSASGKAVWECACDCGGTCLADTSILNSGHKVSCGCSAMHDLSGMRFGMLIVVGRAENIGEKVSWICRCDCGRTATSTTSNLMGGKSTSCGCVRTKHHGKGTRLYRIWTGMKDRCLNENSKYMVRYGGRGIMICPKWAEDFDLFRSWSLRNGYREDLTIDRVDNDQGYCPWNCQWLTRGENSIKARRDNAAKKASI